MHGKLGCLSLSSMSLTDTLINVYCSALSLPGAVNSLSRKYRPIGSADRLATKHLQKSAVPRKETTALDLGCGSRPRNPFHADTVYGVDIIDNSDGNESNIYRADLAEDSLPFTADSFDYCTAFDVLEHIPRISWPRGQRRSSFIELMNEIYRVLKPGGLFLHLTPAFPSKKAFQDPTHVNFITEDTFPKYLCGEDCLGKSLDYGYNAEFTLLEQRWVRNAWITSLLKATK